MNTEIIKIQPGDGPVSEEDDAKLKAAGEILRRGGLVAFPTETVYGLGGDALNPTSSKRIYAAKGRPSDNPLIVHIYRFEDIYKITGDVPEEARRIADAFWPGPLTMILPKSDAVPYETTGGLDTVAIRMPSHPAAQKLIEDAKAVEEAGACMVVLECVPAKLAKKITEMLKVPTIGIGAGADCDGQVLVYQDLLAMYGDFRPKFVKVFANVGDAMREGMAAYIKETKEGTFPSAEHCFKIDDSVIEKLY